MDAEARARQNRRLLFLILGAALFLILLLLPAPRGLGPPAGRMIAVAVLMAVWWLGEAAPIPATALLPLVLFPLLGILPSARVAAFYGHHLIFLFLGGFMIALAMERWNLHKRIALNIIRKTGTGLPRIVLGFMLASAFLSMWISNTATTLMLLPVAMAVVRQVATHSVLPEHSPDQTERLLYGSFGLVLMLGLAYSASIGGIGTLIGTPPNIVFAGFYKTQFPERGEISFVGWMVAALPLVVLMLPLAWWYLCRALPPVPLTRFEVKAGTDAVLAKALKELGPMGRGERFVAWVFGLTALLWVFRRPIALGTWTVPGWSQWLPWPEMAHDATVAMAMGILLMVAPVGWDGRLRRHDGAHLVVLDWDTVKTGLPWGILLLFGGGFALAGGIKATGLDVWIGQKLAAVQAWPLWAVVLLLCLGLTFLTELTSNTATATMILPVAASAASAAGIEPLLLMAPAAVSVSFAFMMPVATPPNAIVFGSGWVSVSRMARAGLILNLLGAGVLTAWTLLWVPRVLL